MQPAPSSRRTPGRTANGWGRWTYPKLAQGGEPDLAVDAAGDAIATWEVYRGEDVLIDAAIGRGGTSWQAPVTISEPGRDASHPQVSVDAAGDATAIWQRYVPPPYTIEAAGYQAGGLALEDLSIPVGGRAGEPLAFSVSPLEVWAALARTTWSFGDGSSAEGTEVTHAYAAAGKYTASVTSEDVLGNLTTASRIVRVHAR